MLNGVEIAHASFANSGAGYVAAIELLSSHGVEPGRGGGLGELGVARRDRALSRRASMLVRCRRVRAAQQRRARRLAKTDTVDAVSTARALLAEPSLGPVQALEVYDALVAKIEAVLEHRRMLVQLRTLSLHHIADQLAKLPTEIRDRLGRSRQDRGPPGPPRTARRSTPAAVVNTGRQPTGCRGCRRPSSTIAGAGGDPPAGARARPVCSTSTAPPCATSPASDRSPRRRSSSRSAIRSASPASPSSLAGAAPAPSPCPPVKAAPRRSGIGSTTAATAGSTACSTSPASPSNASTATPAPTSTASCGEGKTRRAARRAHKRHLASRVIRRMWNDESQRHEPRSLPAA